eukprot:PhF_6_TR12566/c0_g1_i7/m.19700
MEIYQFLWPPQPQRRNRRGMTFRVHPEVALVIWSYLADDLEDMISVYDTCKAWRERSESSPMWHSRKQRAQEYSRAHGHSLVANENDDDDDDDEHPPPSTDVTSITISKLMNFYTQQVRDADPYSWRSEWIGDSWIVTRAMLQIKKVVKRNPRRGIGYTPSEVVAHFLQLRGETTLSKRNALRFAKVQGTLLETMGKKWQQDPEVVWAAVTSDGCAIRFAAKSFQTDRKVMIQAVKSNGNALQYIPEEVRRTDRYLVLKAVKKAGMALQYVPVSFWRNDHEIICSAIRQSGKVFQLLRDVTTPSTYLSDRALVLTAVKNNQSTLRFIGTMDDRLLHDLEIATAAVRGSSAVYHHLPEDVRSDRALAIQYVIGKETMLDTSCIPDVIKKDPSFWIELCNCDAFKRGRPDHVMETFLSQLHYEVADLFNVDDPSLRMFLLMARVAAKVFFREGNEEIVQRLVDHPDARHKFVSLLLEKDPTDVSLSDPVIVDLFLTKTESAESPVPYKFLDCEEMFEKHPVSAIMELVAKHPLAILHLDPLVRKVTTLAERMALWMHCIQTRR